ncbi:hypothetical protein [Rhodococcus oxybenzonivorans]|uniref:hypothetical protein n=1 Tax=Rhodococcus oxybenzonivorans TaxID=1990687 RepID=UPI001E5EE33D|nr:hypothetical protein [Rhodococcus oxybenzonivorans]
MSDDIMTEFRAERLPHVDSPAQLAAAFAGGPDRTSPTTTTRVLRSTTTASARCGQAMD